MILLREWNVDQDREVQRKIKFKPVLFTRSKDPKSANYHAVTGEALDPVKFETMRDATEFVSKYDGVDGFQVYGNDDFVSQFIAREYSGEIQYDQSKIRLFNLDIEVQSAVQMYGERQEMKIRMKGVEKLIGRKQIQAMMPKLNTMNGVEIETHDGWKPIKYFRFTHDDAFPKPELAEWPVTLVGVLDSYDKKYHIFGFGNLDWDPIVACKSYNAKAHADNIEAHGPQHDLTPDDIIYHDCEDESETLREFIKFWAENTPHIYTGWNSEGFDTPYLCNRIEKVLGEESVKELSPWRVVNKRQKEDDYGNMRDVFDIMGVAQLDYMALYKKYTYKAQESYTLNHISHVELKDGKLSYEEAGSLRKLFRMDFQKYVEYNAVDILCVERIERKKHFIDVVLTVAYYAKINYEDTNSPVRTWDVIITNYLMDTRKQVVPAMKLSDKPRRYAGAFVKDPQLGKKGWLLSVDLDSLYPHLIMQWNIGPETLIPEHKLPDPIRMMLDNIEGYDFDEYGDPVIDGERGRDAYIMRFAKFEPDLSALKKYPIGMAGNLACFDNRKQSFISELMEFNYKGRKFDKRQMLAMEQESVWWKTYAENQEFVVREELMTDKRKIGKLKEELLFKNKSGLSRVEALQMAKQCDNEAARLNCMQMAKKILLNSAYGAIGNRYFRFFNIKLAEAITLSGQVAIQFIAERLSNDLNRLLGTPKDANGEYIENQVIAIDTDSNYINVDGIVKKHRREDYDLAEAGDEQAKNRIVDFLDNFGNKYLQKFMDDAYEELKVYTNAKVQKMNMSREAIAQAGFWTAKKRYILKCWDMEGVRSADGDPYWKVMGQDAIKSTTPEIVRGWLKVMYKIIVDKDEKAFQAKIAEYKAEWKTLPVHVIAKNSSCNGINKNSDPVTIYKQEASWQARCGILYNHQIDVLGLENEVDKIIDGDKVKLIELKEPNPVKYSKVAFPSFLDERLGLHDYIDYNLAFEKNFLSPLKRFMEILKWNPEEVATLEAFFM
jgi:DNA polymerase elongation subunit (family B)